MCQTCHGEGGIILEKTWGAEFVPCPSSNCSFDKEAAWAETEKTIKRLESKMMQDVVV